MANDEQIKNIIEQTSKKYTEDDFNYYPLRHLAASGSLLPAWWSPLRDIELRRLTKNSDILSGALFYVISRIASIPFNIIPIDNTVKSYNRQAKLYKRWFMSMPEAGRGWQTFVKKVVQDMFVVDNGWFAEVVGNGEVTGPIEGMPLSLIHLDATQCTRTGDPLFPVVYTNAEGQRFKLHHTRVMFNSQMSSPNDDMYGVGFSAISRCVFAAQFLIDTAIYLQEKLGSRPMRAIMVTGGGLEPRQIQEAMSMTAEALDNRGQTRFSGITVVGSADAEDATIALTSLIDIPDGFNFTETTESAIAIVALAFGIDVEDIFSFSGRSTTRAQALIQHIKQSGRGIGNALAMIEEQVNNLVLPPYLRFEFDFQDDALDRQRAEIRNIASESRRTNIEIGTTDIRTEREMMLANGEITTAQFDSLELKDGRLPDGRPALSLFASPDEEIQLMLTIPGFEDPINVSANNKNEIIPAIEQQINDITAIQIQGSRSQRKKADHAIAALEALIKKYQDEKEEIEPENEGSEGELAANPDSMSLKPSSNEFSMDTDISEDLDMDKSKASMEKALRTQVTRLWRGATNKSSFVFNVNGILEQELTTAWLSGAKECGISLAELTDNEKESLQSGIEEQQDFVKQWADKIEDNNRENEGDLQTQLNSIELWSNRFKDFQNRGKQLACKNEKLEWILGVTEKHCEDCLRLSGRVYRASVWEKYNIRPQSPLLACKGFRCDCSLKKTNARAWAGQPPKLSGKMGKK